MAKFSKATEVEDVASELIDKYHTHLAGETIRYVWRDKHTMSKGKPQLVAARKISGLAGWLHLGYYADHDPDRFTDFFVVEVARDIWDRLDEDQRIALVDHALCQLDVEIPDQGDKDRRLLVRAPDVAEFTAVVQRHGMWRPSIEEFLKAGNQLTLDDQVMHAEPAEDRGEGESE